MSDPGEPKRSGERGIARDAANEIAEQLVSLVEISRSEKLDFLAYLLGMALKEARALSDRQARG